MDVDAVVFHAEYGLVDGALIDVIGDGVTLSPSFYVHLVKADVWTGRDDLINACTVRYDLAAAAPWDGEPFEELWSAWRIDATIAAETLGACESLDSQLFGDDVVTWLDEDATWAFGPGPATDALNEAVEASNPDDWDVVLAGHIAGEYIYRSSHDDEPLLLGFYTVEGLAASGEVQYGNYLELALAPTNGYYTSYPVSGLRVSD